MRDQSVSARPTPPVPPVVKGNMPPLSSPPLDLSPGSVVRQIPAAIKTMRIYQWSKNGLVFMALIFAHRLFDLRADLRVLCAFAIFSLTASTIYIMNDIRDRDSDRMHPTKRERPIPAGRLALPVAYGTAATCTLIAVALMLWLTLSGVTGPRDFLFGADGSHPLFILTIVGYAAMNIAYTLRLKHEVLWDVFIIAAGFVLRAFAGALAIPVPISPWFYLCTLFLALFLALGKRRSELVQLDGKASGQRRILEHYSLPLLDQLMGIVVTSALITYSLYTLQGDAASHNLLLTIPIVTFGLFRYLYLIYVHSEGERPDELLWRDKQILGAVTLCVVLYVMLLYGLPWLHAVIR